MGNLAKLSSSDLELFDSGVDRGKILGFEAKLLEAGGETDTEKLCPITHHFAPGLYARQIFMPAGTCIVGKIHKHAHINNISKGRVLVTTEFGREEFSAPHQFVSLPGTKRAVLVLEDCIWTTYHPTEETDLGKIEDSVIAPSFEEYDNHAKPGLLKRVVNFLLR